MQNQNVTCERMLSEARVTSVDARLTFIWGAGAAGKTTAVVELILQEVARGSKVGMMLPLPGVLDPSDAASLQFCFCEPE